MQIEFLGTGGAVTTPRPGCACRVCAQARARGLPYSRTGPSLFVHGPDVLIDTPEESKEQLNRSRVGRIAACCYSHWHPDHVMGRRVWEARNQDWRHWPPRHTRTDVYLPPQVARDFRRTLGTWEHLRFFEQEGLVRLVELAEGEEVTLGDTRVAPLRLAEEYAYAFLVEGEGQRVLLVPDETHGWVPPARACGVDLAVLPLGAMEFDPLTGARRIPRDHPLLATEATFAETLRLVDALGARRVFLTHIEEMDGLNYDDLAELQRRLRRAGRDITFAFDTLLVDVGPTAADPHPTNASSG